MKIDLNDPAISRIEYYYKYKWMNKYLPRRFIQLPNKKGFTWFGKTFFIGILARW